MIKIGFTGSRRGMTPEQRERFKAVLVSQHFHNSIEFHHGDCVGADEQAHNLVRVITPLARIVVHPPSSSKHRAFCVGDETREPKPYLDRDNDIVAETSQLLACPNGKVKKLRSGTWTTIHYAEEAYKPITIIHFDGTVEHA